MLENDSRRRIKHVAQLNILSLLNRDVGTHPAIGGINEPRFRVEMLFPRLTVNWEGWNSRQMHGDQVDAPT